MKRCILMVLLAAALAACGDDDGPPATPDGGAAIDASAADAGMATFTDFVIDLVEHRTADDTTPVSIDFGLPDPDQNNPDAYKPLFP